MKAKKEALRSENESLLDPGDAYTTSLDSIPLDMPLPYPVFIKFGGRFLLFRNKEDILSKKRSAELNKRSVETIHIRKGDWHNYIESIEKFIEPTLNTKEYVKNIRNLLLAYGRVLESETGLKSGVLGKVQSLAKILVDAIAVTPDLAKQLLKRYNDPSLYFTNHNVNVVIYSVVIGLHINLSLASIRMLAFSGLVHNVGNLYIPKEILYKPAKLSASEFEEVKTHCERGSKILKSLNQPEELVLVALQHHERMDGRGYPNSLDGKSCHLFSKIISIADVYDALTNHRPYEKAYSVSDAIAMMGTMKGKFDPKIMKMAKLDMTTTSKKS